MHNDPYASLWEKSILRLADQLIEASEDCGDGHRNRLLTRAPMPIQTFGLRVSVDQGAVQFVVCNA